MQLWRGQAFADLDSPWAATTRQALEDDRFLARLDHHDVQLRRGRHTALLAGLTALAADRPLDERVVGQCMLALYRSGRQADALTLYERTRRLLADELGADPRPELRELHQGILSADLGGPQVPVDRPGPRQLPSDIRGFVGRDGDIAALDAMLSGLGEPAIVISAIDGAAGIGKTALAVHWAHQVEHRFPDGQLYLDLRGYGPGEPMRPDDALAAMLRSLDVEPERIPAAVDERAALLRSTLASRQVLVLLDNAKDSDQVRPLLPGSNALVLVTSRRKLHALAVRDGARHLTVDLLSDGEALELFAAAVGRDRVGDEPAAASELIRLCARLPLALRLAAERVNGRPGSPLRDLLTDLTDHRGRLAALSMDDGADTDLRSVFAWSRGALDPDAARMFDLLGVHPGGSIAGSAAAALAGIPPARAAATLERLVTLNLVEQRFHGRFELHDLLREYACEQAEARGEELVAARARLLHWYVHSAAAARARITGVPHLMPVAPDPPAGVVPERFIDHGAAVEWFDAEQDTIVKIVRSAGDAGSHRDAAVLAQLAWNYYYLRGLWQQMRLAGEAGVEHAVAAGNRQIEARLRNGLSVAYGYLEGFAEEEVATSREALAIFEELGDGRGQAGALLNLGATYTYAERHAEAREALDRAQHLYLQEGDQLYAAFAQNNLAQVHIRLGRLDDALACARRAADAIRDGPEPFRVVSTLVTLADVHEARGDRHATIEHVRDALSIAGAIGNTHQWISLSIRLGKALSAAGAGQEAVDVWREAHEVCLAQGHPAAEELGRLLTGRGSGNDDGSVAAAPLP